MDKLRKTTISASMPAQVKANSALAINVREQKSVEQEAAKIKAEEEQEAELVASLNDGSYFESSPSDESPAGDAPEEKVESEEGSEEAVPEAVPVLASDDSEGKPEVDWRDIAGGIVFNPANRGFLPPSQEQSSSPVVEKPEQPKTVKQKLIAAMDWLTEDQARLTVVLTVFCMSVYLIIKLIKK